MNRGRRYDPGKNPFPRNYTNYEGEPRGRKPRHPRNEVERQRLERAEAKRQRRGRR